MKRFIITIIICASFFNANAQTSENNFKNYTVGIFAPLYLDSAFTGNSYRYSKTFPKFTFGGLEFINGVQIALDSILIYQANVNAKIFDSKLLPASQFDSSALYNGLDLIIGSVKEDDYTALAALALKKNIPFINVTYPNDGGITGNPFLVILNSTLKAHCEAIYSYVLQNHGLDNIIFSTKDGIQESKVEDYFNEANRPDGSNLIDLKKISANVGFEKILEKLDSTKTNIIIGGSLDRKFATDLATAVAGWSHKYSIKLIGMPNWDAFFTRKNKISSPAIFYTSPYYNLKTDQYSIMLQTAYQKKFNAMPSDLVYKGFESVYIFLKLLAKHPADFMSHLNEYPHKVFSDYNFKPVFLNKKSVMPDYFENKHLYLLKIENGSITSAW
ncbi:MAG: ABC transporter substrate-binding protein [Ferruginibacter sp.]